MTFAFHGGEIIEAIFVSAFIIFIILIVIIIAAIRDIRRKRKLRP